MSRSPYCHCTRFGQHRQGLRSRHPVKPFPGPGEKIPISSGGWRAPVWSRDGRELFYRNGDEVVAVPIVTEPAFRAGRPLKLFEGRYLVELAGQHDYDVSPVGERFLMIGVDDRAVPNELRVVLNWLDEVKAKARR